MKQYFKSNDETDKGDVETIFEMLVLELKLLTTILNQLDDFESQSTLIPYKLTKKQLHGLKVDARRKQIITNEKIWLEVQSLIFRGDIVYFITKLSGLMTSIMEITSKVSATYQNNINRMESKIETQLMKINTLWVDFYNYVKTFYVIFGYTQTHKDVLTVTDSFRKKQMGDKSNDLESPYLVVKHLTVIK